MAELHRYVLFTRALGDVAPLEDLLRLPGVEVLDRMERGALIRTTEQVAQLLRNGFDGWVVEQERELRGPRENPQEPRP